MNNHYFLIHEKEKLPLFEVLYILDRDIGKIVRYRINNRFDRECIFIDRDEFIMLSNFYNEALYCKQSTTDERMGKLVVLVNQMFDHLKSGEKPFESEQSVKEHLDEARYN